MMKKKISKLTLLVVAMVLGAGIIFAGKQVAEGKNNVAKKEQVSPDNLKTDLPGGNNNFSGFSPFCPGPGIQGGCSIHHGGPGFYFRFDPFAEMRRIRQEMDRMFDEFGRFDMMPQVPAPPNVGISHSFSFAPRTDMSDDGKNYIIKIDLPGVDKKNISLKVKRNYLIVSAKRDEKREQKKGNKYIRIERYSGEYQRVLSLPEKIDPQKVTAQYKNGVLTITIPKTKKEDNGITIPIN